MNTGFAENTHDEERAAEATERVKRMGLDPSWIEAEKRNYVLEEVLEEGAHGVVVRARCLITGADVAIKRLHQFA